MTTTKKPLIVMSQGCVRSIAMALDNRDWIMDAADEVGLIDNWWEASLLKLHTMRDRLVKRLEPVADDLCTQKLTGLEHLERVASFHDCRFSSFNELKDFIEKYEGVGSNELKWLFALRLVVRRIARLEREACGVEIYDHELTGEGATP